MQRFFNTLFLIIMLAAGVALTALGAQLFTLGGSPWYMVSGIIMVLTAVLGFRHKALSVYLFLPPTSVGHCGKWEQMVGRWHHVSPCRCASACGC
jgi:quinoprotein glucose dehydrogenase